MGVIAALIIVVYGSNCSINYCCRLWYKPIGLVSL